MADRRSINKWLKNSEMYQLKRMPVIDLTSSDYEPGEGSQPKRRKVKRHLLELLPSRTSTPVSQMEVNQILEESDAESTRALAPSPASTSNHNQVNAPQAPKNCHTHFYSWLVQTAILDDLSFREPFINPVSDANKLTDEDLLLQGVRLYHNAHLLSPQELVDLPFIPRQMVTGYTMLDVPFLDPLLVVLWIFNIDDVHWMLNVLPWRVVDRPIRTGRSILAWIVEIDNIHQFLEDTRAPLSITMKIIKFLDNYFE